MDIWTNAKNLAVPVQRDTSADPKSISPTAGIHVPPNSKIRQAVGGDGAYGDEGGGYDGGGEVQWSRANYIRRPHHMRV